jgi:hypothetical protein
VEEWLGSIVVDIRAPVSLQRYFFVVGQSVPERDGRKKMHSGPQQPSPADTAACADISRVRCGSHIVEDLVHQFLGEVPHEGAHQEKISFANLEKIWFTTLN